MTDSSNQPGTLATAGVQPGPMEDADRFGVLNVDAVHELANLMTVVGGSLEQLRRQPLNDQGQQQLARAEWGVRRAGRLMQHVLSHAQAGKRTAEVVDLNAVAGGFAAVMGPSVGEGVQLSAELAPERLPVRLDPDLLELVLLNLVRNAVDAMPDGGLVVLRTKGPRLDSLGDQLTAEVSVSDSGTGMTPDVAGRAATAFFTTKPPGKGTGLGLWMAQRFAATHGGRISIETAPGQGTNVLLVFPYAGDAEPG